jgi:hypothetical protein
MGGADGYKLSSSPWGVRKESDVDLVYCAAA